jgi:hypothetical protein
MAKVNARREKRACSLDRIALINSAVTHFSSSFNTNLCGVGMTLLGNPARALDKLGWPQLTVIR